MPVTSLSDTRPASQAVRVAASAPSELFWLTLFLMRGERLPEDHPVAQLAKRQPELHRRVSDFWPDAGEGYTELFVLGQRGGTLFEPAAERFVASIDAAVHAPDGPLGLESETPEEIAAVRSRLARLRDDAELRGRYVQLLSDAWAAVRELWEASGQAAVEEALREWPERLERSTDLVAALPKRHITQKYLPMLESAQRRGEVVLTPLYLAGMGHLIELPGVLLIGVGILQRDKLSYRRAEAEAVVSRLKVLADPTRVLILTLLSTTSMSVGELVEELQLSQPTISVHVRHLREAGLLDVRREGGRTVYSTTPERVDAVLDGARTALRGICE
jgi:DNA-binding transcriptional ArsR family regulator